MGTFVLTGISLYDFLLLSTGLAGVCYVRRGGRGRLAFLLYFTRLHLSVTNQFDWTCGWEDCCGGVGSWGWECGGWCCSYC